MMSGLLSIIGVVFILSLLVLIHEWGHFIMAIRNGIKVDEFGIGFPPNIFKFKGKKTTYSINWIPLGGFVKLHGEDATDKKFFKDKHSFSSKTPWQKVQVICAGVVMNFLVFWVLMSAAIMIGVNPLIVSEEDYFEAFENGTFVSEPFMRVESVLEGSKADSLGIKVEDSLLAVNDMELLSHPEVFEELLGNQTEEVFSLSFSRDGDKKFLTKMENVESLEDFGLKFYPSSMLPVMKLTRISEDSALYEKLFVGDKVYAVNGSPVFDFTGYQSLLENTEAEIEFKVLRDNKLEVIALDSNERQIIADLVEGAPAQEAGLEKGDKILRVEGTELKTTDNLPSLIASLEKEVLKFEVERGAEILEFEVSLNEEGMIGVLLSPEYNYLDFAFDFQAEYVLSSLVEIKQIKEPFYRAPLVALDKGFEMSILTAKAFGGALFGVVTNLEVSDEVGGPVQVVKMGSEFVNKGGVALMTFVAMISLSLAVINILPIPALDGGRLIFIIIEAFRGRPLSPKYEALIHFIGFWLLILFIMVVTFYDIVRF